MEQNNTLKIQFNPNGASINFNIPIKDMKIPTEQEIYDADIRKKHYLYDMLGSFAPRLIEAIQSRMEACRVKLISHIGEAWTPCEGFICWERKNGQTDHFIVPSYQKMELGIKYLQTSQWNKFLDIQIVDQTIKALLNMPELDHSDCGGFRFSELVSALMECITVPAAMFDRRKNE